MGTVRRGGGSWGELWTRRPVPNGGSAAADRSFEPQLAVSSVAPGAPLGGGLLAHNGDLALRVGFRVRRRSVAAVVGSPRLAHRFALEFDPIGLMHQAIHQGIGHRRVAHQFMPLTHGELAGALSVQERTCVPSIRN